MFCHPCKYQHVYTPDLQCKPRVQTLVMLYGWSENDSVVGMDNLVHWKIWHRFFFFIAIWNDQNKLNRHSEGLHAVCQTTYSSFLPLGAWKSLGHCSSSILLVTKLPVLIAWADGSSAWPKMLQPRVLRLVQPLTFHRHPTPAQQLLLSPEFLCRQIWAERSAARMGFIISLKVCITTLLAVGS